MSYRGLTEFLQEAIEDSKEQNTLFSVHLKATMMKVSDPIIFGAVVKAYYADVFEKYHDVFEEIGFDANNGMRTLDHKLALIDPSLKAEIEAAIDAVEQSQPLACPNTNVHVTNLDVPSDVIIDASMAAKLRYSGTR